uniref:Uncharacterized protein n=1 Tax=Tanacetum cinerariifolium TaxID=118510 RepID=A0A6L2NMJ9_TANCI|nr:hypothetical protein [Tanacetum cinerariifolium]
MNLLNEECLNCVYGIGKPLTCNKCGGMLRGGFSFPCNFKAENSFICDQGAYSFNDPSYNSNYLPQLQYENYLCNLCGNNSHDGYDCQQQFPFVYEQEPSYNQNYNDDYYPYESPIFPCCDNCEGSHETFQCQPITQNIDFSGSDQIQTLQYPDVHPPSQEISDEVFQANHCVQYKENLENSLNSNQEKEEPPQDSDVRQLIREECSVKVCEEQNALNSKLLLINSNSQLLDKKEQEVKNVIEHPAKRRNRKHEHPLSMGYEHLSITPEMESDEVTNSNAENLLPIPSECEPCTVRYGKCNKVGHLNRDCKVTNSTASTQKGQVVKQRVVTCFDITPEMESDEVTNSNAENLLPILSECEVTLEDESKCDVPISENSPICDDHSEIFFDSKDDDDISVYDDDFEDIEYVEASLFDPEIVNQEEENVVQHEEEEVNIEDISQIQDVVLCEKLFSITHPIANIESLNDDSTPDRVLNSFESDNSLSDNFSPKFKTFCDHTEETRSGKTTHADNSLPEYNSFCFEIEPNQERLINVLKNDISDNSSNDPL